MSFRAGWGLGLWGFGVFGCCALMGCRVWAVWVWGFGVQLLQGLGQRSARS